MDDAESVLHRAKIDGDDRLALQALRENRESLSLCMKAIGMLSEAPVVNIDARKIELNVAMKALPSWVLSLLALEATDAEAKIALVAVEQHRAAVVEGELVEPRALGA